MTESRIELRERQDAETRAFLDEAYANPGKWLKVPLHLGVVPLAARNRAPDGTFVEVVAALDLSVFDFYCDCDRSGVGQVWARRKTRPADLPTAERDS